MMIFVQEPIVAFLLFFFVITTVSSSPYLTCYMTYHNEETRSEQTNGIIGFSFYQSHISQYVTPEGQLCSQVGCVCFSYQSDCAIAPGKSNHFSSCTQIDQANHTIKWHRGWTSTADCEKMKQQPQIYRNLTCCSADRCNDQPGKIIHLIQTPGAVQRHPDSQQQPSTSSSTLPPVRVFSTPASIRRYEPTPREIVRERPRVDADPMPMPQTRSSARVIRSFTQLIVIAILFVSHLI